MKSQKNTGLTMVPVRPNNAPGESLLGHIWASIAATIVLGIICCAIYPAIVWGIGRVFFPWQANGSLLDKNGNPTTDDTQAVGSALIGQNFSASGYFQPRPSAAGNGYDATSSGGTNLGPLSDKLLNGATTPATTQPTTQPETVAGDGIRFRVIQYAVSNGISFDLYHAAYVKSTLEDGTENDTLQKQNLVAHFDGTKFSVPLPQFQNSDGSLNETALIDAFPHPTLNNDLTLDATTGKQVWTARPMVIAEDFSTPIPGDAVTASGSGLDPHISPANAELQAPRVAGARNISIDVVKTFIDQYTDRPSLGILGDPGVNVLRLNLALDAKYPIPAPAPTMAPATQPAAQLTTQPAK